MIFSLFSKDPQKETAARLFGAIAQEARNPYFFTELEAPDTVEGRFEILTLHMYAVLRRLKKQGPEAEAFSQKLFDAFFRNMDDSLRELGVGDMSIGRKIRTMAEAFYGRVGAYEKALDDAAREDLAAALSRNVYGVEAHHKAPALARYLETAAGALAARPIEPLLQGSVAFPDPAAAKAEAVAEGAR